VICAAEGERDTLRSRAAGIDLIINVRAHANHRDPDRRRALAELIGKPDRVVTTQSLEDLHAACLQLASDPPAIVAICGGDGTLHQTLTALVHSYGQRPLPAIAILRGGTMNTVAESLGIRGDPVAHLRALVALMRRSVASARAASARIETFEQGLVRVDDRFGFMFGTGVIHDYLNVYYATGKPSRVTAARLLVRAGASTLVHGPLSKRLCSPFRARVVVDGITWPRDRFVAVCAATINQIGLGFRPFYRCRERVDGFAVLGIHTTCMGLMRELPRIHAGKPIRQDRAIDDVAREVTIAPIDPCELGYAIDGDLYTCDRPLTLTRGPTLTLVRLSPAT
jgi:diacylglycerol kinase family enzyme